MLNWKLASLDDDARRRLAFTVATIRGLKAQGELAVNQMQVLLLAEQRLAALAKP